MLILHPAFPGLRRALLSLDDVAERGIAGQIAVGRLDARLDDLWIAVPNTLGLLAMHPAARQSCTLQSRR